MENWSFDGMFGLIKGVDGISPENYIVQVDKNGVAYEFLEPPTDGNSGNKIDDRFPEKLNNSWINVTQYVPNANKTRDLVHRFYTHQAQINGGKNDKFYAYTDAAALVMSYVGTYADLPFQQMAAENVLCTRYFQGHFGGSFLSHYWIVANQAPIWPNETKPVPLGFQSDMSNGRFYDAELTTDGTRAVNTIYSENQPHPPSIPFAKRLPPQTMPNIGDKLTEKGVDWKWYSGGWDKTIANPNVTDWLFQYHHQPFAYFAKYGDNTEGRKQHLRDEKEFYADLDKGQLPPVSWVKFYGIENEHPGYADLVDGNVHLANTVNRIKASSAWANSLIIVTHDEFGGRFDHVPPPVVDEFGPGSRIGTILISPFTKKSFLDDTMFYSHDSLNKFLSLRFNITPLNKRVENALYFENAFDWNTTGKCCQPGEKLKTGKQYKCFYNGACADCCEPINVDSKGLFVTIIVALFLVGLTFIFLIVAALVVFFKNSVRPALSIQYSSI